MMQITAKEKKGEVRDTPSHRIEGEAPIKLKEEKGNLGGSQLTSRNKKRKSVIQLKRSSAS